jgi:hypothetical protein
MSVDARPWHRLIPPLAAVVIAVALAVGPARAGYQGSVYSNITAFSVCDSSADTISAQLRDLARDAFTYFGYSTTAFGGKTFTKTTVLARDPADVGVYVHSHGDFYGAGQIQGFRADGGTCTQSIVYATEIKKARTTPDGRLVGAKLVIMSTCHLAEAPRNGYPAMSEAYGIERLKSDPSGAGYRGPEFFLSYRGLAWSSDMLRFESAFWGYATDGWNLGDAFRLARAGNALRWGTVPDWFGTYTYSGRPQPVPPCLICT